jgi:hypothetical protein
VYAAPVQEKKWSIFYSNFRQDALQGRLQRSEAGGSPRSDFKRDWFASWIDDLDDRPVSFAFSAIIITHTWVMMLLAGDIRAA